MDKKVLSGAIAAAVAAGTTPWAQDAQAGHQSKPNARSGLDNPLEDVECHWHEGEAVHASWFDPNEEGKGTKYGGDLEWDAWLSAFCTWESEVAQELAAELGINEEVAVSELAIVDVDLSRDAEDPFSYDCEYNAEEQAECDAFISAEAIQEITDEAASSAGLLYDEECDFSVEACFEETSEGPELLFYCSGPILEQEGNMVCETFGGGFQECEVLDEQFFETVTFDGTAAGSGEVLGNFLFSVKDMDPSIERGGLKKQNYTKGHDECGDGPYGAD